MQAYWLSPDYSNEELEIGAWLKQLFGVLWLDSQEDEDCVAFDIIPKAPEITK